MRVAPIRWLWLLAVMAGGVAAAEPAPATGDPLRSAECQSALEALQTAESAAGWAPSSRSESPSSASPAPSASGSSATKSPGARATTDARPMAPTNEAQSSRMPTPNLVAARRQAATACLAGRADSLPQPQRLAQPPFVVAPVAGAASPRINPALPLSSPSPAPVQPNAPAAPNAILSCDVVGCWANDGSRLNKVGPNLWGPRGACTVQGTLLHCP